METVRLILTEQKAYFFYAKDCATQETVKLQFQDKEKGGLISGTIVSVTVKKQWNTNTYEFIGLISEEIPDGREKVIEDSDKYSAGDQYDGTVILSKGKAFIKSGKKVNYLYFK